MDTNDNKDKQKDNFYYWADIMKGELITDIDKTWILLTKGYKLEFLGNPGVHYYLQDGLVYCDDAARNIFNNKVYDGSEFHFYNQFKNLTWVIVEIPYDELIKHSKEQLIQAEYDFCKTIYYTIIEPFMAENEYIVKNSMGVTWFVNKDGEDVRPDDILAPNQPAANLFQQVDDTFKGLSSEVRTSGRGMDRVICTMWNEIMLDGYT